MLAMILVIILFLKQKPVENKTVFCTYEFYFKKFISWKNFKKCVHHSDEEKETFHLKLLVGFIKKINDNLKTILCNK